MRKDVLCFVYGSLMKGMGNHRVLSGARFVRMARTAPSFTLRDLGAYPGMTNGGATRVHGEVYAVDEEMLVLLDRLEGHPGFYRRQQIALAGGRRASAYLLPDTRYASYPIVVGGDWRAHLGRDRRLDGEPSATGSGIIGACGPIQRG